MNTPLHPYPAYVPSCVQWLGDVPKHWNVAQLGRIGVFFKGSGGTKDDEVPEGVPCVRYGDLYTSHKHFISQTRSFVAPEIAGSYTPIHRGDVLFPQSGETIEEIGKSAVNLIDGPAVCGGDVIVFRPTVPAEPRFMGYALDCPPAQTQKSMMGRGITIMHIYSGQLKYLRMPVPPLSEQRAIVRYLDQVDARIRRLIDAKHRVISLLEEERQAVINQAVTRGLDANVPLKPSGVDWLGDIPAHWETVPNKSVMEFKRVIVGQDFTNYELLSLTKQGVVPRDLTNPTGKFPESFESYQIVEPGDLIFCLFDIDETPRTVGIAEQEGMVTGAYTRFSCTSDVTRKFIYLVYLSLDDKKALKPLYTGLRKVITKASFLGAKTPLPSLAEQQAIIEHVDQEWSRIDSAVTVARSQIQLLEEYRTRLIEDVVTGKLDVREAAAQLPGIPSLNEADDKLGVPR